MDEPVKHCPDPDCPYMKEYGRAAEYEADVAACLDCGAPLAFGPPPARGASAEDVARSANLDELVEVASLADPFQAQMYLAWLREADIHAVVTNKLGTRLIPGLSGGEVRIRVPAAEAERAAALLDDLEHPTELDEDFFDDDDPDPDDDGRA